MNNSDRHFIDQFENQTLPPEKFNHLGHLRLAWLYLATLPLEDAIATMTHGLRVYAASLGASEKFHHTLTEALLRIMAARITNGKYTSFDAFLEDNQDIVNDASAVVAEHYSKDCIMSSAAKESFIQPDKLAIQTIK